MVTTKRWNDPKSPGDGLRVLVTRYRPRGLPKSEETWDVWMRDLAPSAELHAAFYGKNGTTMSWSSYRAAFLTEMTSAKLVIRKLVDLIQSGQSVTLLCSSACIQDERCHRSLLREIIVAETRSKLAAETMRITGLQ